MEHSPIGLGVDDVRLAMEFERALRGRRIARSVLPPTPVAWREQTVRAGTECSDSFAEVPVGADDRVFVGASTTPSSNAFPFNTICYIETRRSDGRVGRGSGTLIAPQLVLTAGHVLRSKASVRLMPGADLSASTPSDRQPATPGQLDVPSSRFRFHGSLDIALAIPEQAFSQPSEFMMLQPRGDANTATLLTIAGFPGRTTPPPGWTTFGTMWRHTEHVRPNGVTPTHLSYSIDTSKGQSGSPLWLLGNNNIRLLLGVHTTGETDPPPGINQGVRITRDVIDWIDRECRALSVTGPIVDRVAYRAVAGGAP